MWSTFRHIWKAQFVEDYFVKRSFFTRPLRQAAKKDEMCLAIGTYFVPHNARNGTSLK